MLKICDTMEEIRDDPALEASYMQWQVKLMDREMAGREEGREEGIRAMVRTLQGLSLSRDSAAQSLENAFTLPPETAREKVDRYWQ